MTNDQYGDFEYPPILPSEDNGDGFRAGLFFPSGQGTMPASPIPTVFSFTHPDLPVTRSGLWVITDIGMLAPKQTFRVDEVNQTLIDGKESGKTGK